MLETPTHQTAPGLHGILFAEDFDDEPMVKIDDTTLSDAMPTPDIMIDAVQFSADDLAAARQEGYAAGRDAGMADAKGRHDKAIAAACDAIAAGIERDAAARADQIEQSVAAIARLLMDTLAAMLPATCARSQAREVADVVRTLVGDMTGEAVMRVSVAASLLDDLRSALISLPPPLLRRVVLFPTDDVAEGDALLTWDQGTASFSAARGRRAVMEVLVQLQLIQPERDTAPRILRPGMPTTETLSSLPIKEGETINA